LANRFRKNPPQERGYGGAENLIRVRGGEIQKYRLASQFKNQKRKRLMEEKELVCGECGEPLSEEEGEYKCSACKITVGFTEEF